MATAAITKEASIRSIVVVVAAAVLVVFALSSVAFTQVPTNEACTGAFEGSPEGSLAKEASRDGAPLTDGATVEPGDEVTFTITWDTTDWEGEELDQLHDCFEMNSEPYPSLDYEEKPVVNDGSASHTITIPELNNDDVLCDRARLSGDPAGDNASTQKSNTLCFVVGEVEDDVVVDDDDTVVLDNQIEDGTEVLGVQLAKTGSATTALAIAGLMLLSMGWITRRRARVLDARR